MTQADNDLLWMQRAYQLAKEAVLQDEVPVGAVLVKDAELIAGASNQPIQEHDPTAHAEVLVLRQAGKALGNYRLLDTTLYVTLEPCLMCVGAMVHARIKRLVFGAKDPKAGAICSVFQGFELEHLNHRPAWEGGVLQQPCAEILKAFFRAKRSSGRVA